jgi:hypothetical protein
VGGWGAEFRELLLFELELELELDFDFDFEPGLVVVVVPDEPARGVVAAARFVSEPVASTVLLAAVGCGRASTKANRPVAPAAATTSHRVMRETRWR